VPASGARPWSSSPCCCRSCSSCCSPRCRSACSRGTPGAPPASVSLQDADARAAALRAAPGLDPERLEVAVAREGGQGTVVTVEVAYRARIAGPIAGWLLPAEVTLEGAAAMRQEVG
jgi:hypothetical protein